MAEPSAAAPDCDHFFETRILGGQPLSVRLCVFCRVPDWADLREQMDVLYGGNEAALTRVFGGDRTASVIAHALNAHGHAIERVRYMTDERLLAVPGIGETSLATIRAAFPALEPRLLDCGFCYEEQGEEVHPHPECPVGAPMALKPPLRDLLHAAIEPILNEWPERNRTDERQQVLNRVVNAVLDTITPSWEVVATAIDAALNGKEATDV